MGDRLYEVKVMPHAERSLKALRRHHQVKKRILDAMDDLAEVPRPEGCTKLKGKYDNQYRTRVGDWRILYAVEDTEVIVLVLDVVPRDQAYR